MRITSWWQTQNRMVLELPPTISPTITNKPVACCEGLKKMEQIEYELITNHSKTHSVVCVQLLLEVQGSALLFPFIARQSRDGYAEKHRHVREI